MSRLKNGVALFESSTPGEFFIGTFKRAIRIYTPEQKLIAQYLSSRSFDEVAAEFPAINRIQIEKLATELEQEKLLDHSVGALQVSKRFHSKLDNRAKKNSDKSFDAGLNQLHNRTQPELAQTNWIKDVEDGGAKILSARQKYLVEISGNNRVATLLFSLLLASGFSQTRFTPHSRGNSPLIGDLELGLASFRATDIGNSFKSHCEFIRREIALFPLDKERNYLDELAPPNLRVHCGDFDPEILSLWMSTGQPFIHIPSPLADQGRIGPLVIPGKSPCLRCLALSERDQNGICDYQILAKKFTTDYPQIAAHFIAALAASHIAQYFDNQSCEIQSNGPDITDGLAKAELVGNVISIDYQFLSHPEVIAITRHPLCGCAF
jgi:hypothetical protein